MAKHSPHSLSYSRCKSYIQSGLLQAGLCVQIILQILKKRKKNHEIVQELRRSVKRRLSQMSTCWVNFSFSDDPGKRPKPSGTICHLPTLEQLGQVQREREGGKKKENSFLLSNFPMIVTFHVSKNVNPVTRGGRNKATGLKSPSCFV